jgi:uncharacterized protein YndB with AHSA1/START domain
VAADEVDGATGQQDGAAEQPAELGVLERVDEGWRVSFVRELPASPDQVWDALTDPERLARWLTATSLEPRVGGAVEHDFDGDVVTGTIEVWEPPRSLAYSWIFSDGTASQLRIDLAPSPAGTELTLRHTGLPDRIATGYGAGWHGYLDRLEAIVVGDVPPSWDDRFSELLPTYQALA